MSPTRRSSGRAAPSRAAVLPLALLLTVLASAGPAWGARNEPPSSSLAGTVGLLRVSSAAVQTRGVLSLSLAGHYYESDDASSELATEAAGRYTSLHLGGSYGVTSWLELAVDLPFRRASWDAPDGDVRGEALDSPVVAAKMGAPLGAWPLRFAVEGRFRVPLEAELTVGAPGGDQVFLTGGTSADWQALFLATLDLTESFPLRLHANVGWAANRDKRGRRFYPDYYPATEEGEGGSDALVLRGALEFPGRNVDLFTEFVGDLSENDTVIAAKENPLTLTPGVRVRMGSVSATVGFSVSLSGNDAETQEFDPHVAYPDWELTASIGYGWPVTAADTDGDGIPDFRDACRTRPEDRDGFRDEDGCPDDDNDGDGIMDDADLAPGLAEDVDGYEDTDGVPDLDNDGDGIIDERDMCPDEAEDLDGFEDEDGCPDG